MNDSKAAEPAGKAARIISAAREAFFEQGYDAVSMHEVARRAGVAKQTVYSHYASKEALFLAMAEREWQQLRKVPSIPATTTPATARERLQDIGLQLLELILSPPVQSLMRVAIAAAHRFPSLGRSTYEALVKHRIAYLVDIIGGGVDAGALRSENAQVAAEHFTALIRGRLFVQSLLDPSFKPSQSEMIEQVDHAMDCFLARYGVSVAPAAKPPGANRQWPPTPVDAEGR
jgi:TetR/AcrR family transcriptional repressor of mexJK operon